jgi:hypothetical protein
MQSHWGGLKKLAVSIGCNGNEGVKITLSILPAPFFLVRAPARVRAGSAMAVQGRTGNQVIPGCGSGVDLMDRTDWRQ